jgi:hypothetical protein
MGVACSTYGGEERGIQGFGGKTEGRDHLEDWGLDRKMILKWIFTELRWGAWTGLIWLVIVIGGGSCECGNELCGSMKWGKFLD